MTNDSVSKNAPGKSELEIVAFKTRARTIDHLGRGQIADAPTAVSELWKNAWDAYATQVSLNIFDGHPSLRRCSTTGQECRLRTSPTAGSLSVLSRK